jgi:hypothetical protein
VHPAAVSGAGGTLPDLARLALEPFGPHGFALAQQDRLQAGLQLRGDYLVVARRAEQVAQPLELAGQAFGAGTEERPSRGSAGTVSAAWPSGLDRTGRRSGLRRSAARRPADLTWVSIGLTVITPRYPARGG